MEMDDVDGVPEEDGLGNRLGYGGIEVDEDEFAQLLEGEMGEELREQGRSKREMILDELFPLADYV